MAWRFEWRRAWPEVWEEEFLQTWRVILEQDPHSHVFQRPEMFRAWAETRAEILGAEPMVGLATNAGQCRVLLPWIVMPYPGRFIQRRVLEPVGQNLFCYHDPLVEGRDTEGIDWQGFWEAARKSVDGACDHALVRFVHPRYAQGRHSEPCGERNPVLNLAGLSDLDAALARSSANHRNDVRRRFRRLAEKGEVTFWVAAPEEVPAALSDLREHFLPAYHAVWHSRPTGVLLDKPGLAGFVTRVVADGLPTGWAHYSVLRVSGTPIAWHLGLVHRDELFWWIPTYDPAWGYLAPGKVLLAKLVEHAITRGRTRIHLLTGDQRYKYAWRPDALDLRAVRWHAPSLRGWFCRWYDRFHRTPESETMPSKLQPSDL